MKPFGKKLACLLSPVKRLHDDLGRLLEEKKNKEEEIAGLERKITSLEQDNSVLADDCSRLDQRLRRIDTRYLTRVTRSLMPEPAAGEVARNYYVETVSHCDLRCGLCAHGHAKLFQRRPGRMSLQLFEEILDKIKEESPLATVAPYHYSEPMLHPQLPEMLSAIKNRGLSA
ncbi:MAG: hypothetical protein LUH04_14185, partial [Clostridium sp.]|nr:hypothetical protein [Clostridium sp.]